MQTLEPADRYYLNVENGERDERIVINQRAESLVQLPKQFAKRLRIKSVEQIIQVPHFGEELQVKCWR